MNTARRRWLAGILVAALAAAGAGCAEEPSNRPPPTLRAPDVPYEPAAPAVVNEMLKLGRIAPGNTVYDLGCGDGRVVIAAVRDYAARGVCVDIDPRRIAEARANAAKAGVSGRIEFRNEDLFTTRIADADAVMLFLWPEVNLALRPRLLEELKPGTRVVSHWHTMGAWEPERTVHVSARGRSRPLYLWTIPRPEARPVFPDAAPPRRP
ncbi:MAG: class I SAM-dependent methyltransferase [Burkholderiales bacterium]|nr:class I SAM-dependent methyltransferase [Burkholderiales bacterium]